jgi:hypothetical protein
VARLWLLHPQPGPVESLSSWLDRLGRLYDLSVKDLLNRNLDLPSLAVPWDLDYGPPARCSPHWRLHRHRTDRLRAMTLARWEPWLFDTRYLRPWDAQTKIATARRRLIAVPGR